MGKMGIMGRLQSTHSTQNTHNTHKKSSLKTSLPPQISLDTLKASTG